VEPVQGFFLVPRTDYSAFLSLHLCVRPDSFGGFFLSLPPENHSRFRYERSFCNFLMVPLTCLPCSGQFIKPLAFPLSFAFSYCVLKTIGFTLTDTLLWDPQLPSGSQICFETPTPAPPLYGTDCSLGTGH